MASLQGGGLEVEGRRVHVREGDLVAAARAISGYHPEGQRRKDDLGAGRKLQRLEDVVGRHAAVGGRDRAAAAQTLPEGVLELGMHGPSTS
jgi:hypothetical protein